MLTVLVMAQGIRDKQKKIQISWGSLEIAQSAPTHLPIYLLNRVWTLSFHLNQVNTLFCLTEQPIATKAIFSNDKGGTQTDCSPTTCPSILLTMDRNHTINTHYKSQRLFLTSLFILFQTHHGLTYFPGPLFFLLTTQQSSLKINKAILHTNFTLNAVSCALVNSLAQVLRYYSHVFHKTYLRNIFVNLLLSRVWADDS